MMVREGRGTGNNLTIKLQDPAADIDALICCDGGQEEAIPRDHAGLWLVEYSGFLYERWYYHFMGLVRTSPAESLRCEAL